LVSSRTAQGDDDPARIRTAMVLKRRPGFRLQIRYDQADPFLGEQGPKAFSIG